MIVINKDKAFVENLQTVIASDREVSIRKWGRRIEVVVTEFSDKEPRSRFSMHSFLWDEGKGTHIGYARLLNLSLIHATKAMQEG